MTISEGPISISAPMALAISGSCYRVGAEELPAWSAFQCNLFTSPKALGVLSLDGFRVYLSYQTSSLTAKTESCTCVFLQTYPFQHSSLEGPALTFQAAEIAQKTSGPRANLDLHPLTSPTQQSDPGFSLSPWPPALYLTCIYLTSLSKMTQDPTSALPAVLLSLLLTL